MDWGALAGWAVAVVTLAIYLQSIRYRGKDESALKMTDMLKPIFEQLARHEGHHGKHFYAENATTSLVASINQKVDDNKRHTDDRLDRDGEMLAEIRSDIKTLLKRS